jgi:hypothetical protein
MMTAMAPPADSPATKIFVESTSNSPAICLVIPAMMLGSPASRRWSFGSYQFQHDIWLAEPGCSG